MRKGALFTFSLLLFTFFPSAFAEESDWPLISIRTNRHFDADPSEFAAMAQLFEQYPGACDDIWFCAKGYADIEVLKKEVANVDRVRQLFAKSGAKVSFQQGVTLGHGSWPNGIPPKGSASFPDDTWQVSADGRLRKGLFCPRAEATLSYHKAYVKTVVERVRPYAYWLDDDLRLGIVELDRCFCPRCLAAFNAKTGGSWTRETLTARLYDKTTVHEPVRRAWIDFNAESLAIFGKAAREAIDELGSDCRLAYQAVWSDTIYTGWDKRPLLTALSRNGAVTTGIRPGACWYDEIEGCGGYGMMKKCFSVARDAERCKNYGPWIGTVCHEMETYPRHFLNKSPGMIVAECALAMASGCDAVSVYWYCTEPQKPVSEHERLVKRLAVARPYFERMRTEVRRTRLGGVARYIGSAAAECPAFDLRDEDDARLASVGIPVTCAEAKQGVWYVNAKSAEEMTAADWEELAKTGAVVTDKVRKTHPEASAAKFGRVEEFSSTLDVAHRQALLTAFDKLQAGGLPVRIDESRPVRVLPRIDGNGRTSSVTLYNLSAYGMDDVTVRIRRPAGGRVEWLAADGSRVSFTSERRGDELVVCLADLPGGAIGTLFLK